jgi:hypothetical protein
VPDESEGFFRDDQDDLSEIEDFSSLSCPYQKSAAYGSDLPPFDVPVSELVFLLHILPLL